MRRLLIPLSALALAAPALAQSPPATGWPAASPRAKAWAADIAALSDDAMEGRLTGSAGYLRAAAYVEKRMAEEGLQPAGENGTWRQAVAFTAQTIDQAASTAALIGPDGASEPLTVGADMLISAGGGPRPEHVSAPLVFIGYGLHLPEQGWDDFAGVDLKGKIAVVISGGPPGVPGTIKATARFERAELLAKAGAVGLITLVTPSQVEIPWQRQKLLSGQSGMFLADPALRETPDGFFAGSFDPAQAQRLFEGSAHGFAELAALADKGEKVPSFDLARRLQAKVAASRSAATSPNVIGVLPGSHPKLKARYVALSAHLDHLGVGAPINGDRVYNGAMDDASGVAALLDIAHRLRSGPRPKRSVLFVIVCAEEKGLLGSAYFAGRPTVPKGSIIADLNFDMPLPLWTLKSVLAQGAQESSLGDDASAVAKAQRLTLVADPLPDRNSFIRTDQFSFVRRGLPALAFKFGFAKDTPEFQIEHDWRANRYHSPSDDMAQPGVLPEEAVKLDAFVAAVALRVANARAEPAWRPESVFRRYGGK